MSTLRELLDAHIRQVDRRVGEGPYAVEKAEVRRAALVVEELQDRLGLGELLGDLSPGVGKPQILLAFRGDRGDTVLKVYGKPRPNEAAVQGLWAAAGVATPEVLDSADRPVSWLLMPKLPGGVPPVERPGLTAAVARILDLAHAVYSPDAGEPKDLFAGVGPHLRNVLDVAVEHGYAVPADVDAVARAVYASGTPTFLHGDLATVNLLMSPTGGLSILDTCGYTGPAEFDAARWAARVGGSAGAEPVLDEWCSTESRLDHDLARRLLGLELLMEAGVREIIKDERGLPWSERDAETLACLDRGRRLAGFR